MTELLNYFGIEDTKKGTNYDLGPYEEGVASWIPSSKGKPIEPPHDWSSSGWYPSIHDSSSNSHGSSSTPHGSSSGNHENSVNNAYSTPVSLVILLVSFFIMLVFC